MKSGKVIIQEGALIQPHELKVGELLARTGSDVTFLAVGVEKISRYYVSRQEMGD